MTDWTDEERDLLFTFLFEGRSEKLTHETARGLVDRWDSIGDLRTSIYYELKQIADGEAL